MIQEMARCDGPECSLIEPTPAVHEYPDGWIVLTLSRSHDALGWPIGRFGFHSIRCLTDWSYGRQASDG